MPRLSPPTRRTRPFAQRGVASLVVVMILFFILALVAAYTNRNLIFEQRTATNQYRSTQALEAAQAGLEWALAMLNSSRITDACAPSLAITDPTFRQRYLDIHPDTGMVQAKLQSDGVSTLMPSCVFDGSNWNCHCPADGNPVVAAPAGAGVFPAFRVRFLASPAVKAGLVRIEVNGCTRLDDTCLNFPSAAVAGEGRASVQTYAALRSGLGAAPTAALTARESIDLGRAALAAFNTSTATTGITILAGGAVNPAGLRLESHPGTPADTTLLAGDAALAALSDERMFTNTFGALPAVYRQQPAALRPPCTAGVCNATQVRDLAAINPGRVIWVEGDLSIDTGGDVGSPTEPLVLVVDGNLSFSLPVDVYGLVYSRSTNWSMSGPGRILGAAVAEGRVSGSATTQIEYDRAVLNRLRFQTGSFVLVPGSWRDFE